MAYNKQQNYPPAVPPPPPPKIDTKNNVQYTATQKASLFQETWNQSTANFQITQPVVNPSKDIYSSAPVTYPLKKLNETSQVINTSSSENLKLQNEQDSSQNNDDNILTDNKIESDELIDDTDNDLSEQSEKNQNNLNNKRKFQRREMIRKRDPFRAKIFRRSLKKRRNAYFKRMLMPKNACKILLELCPNMKITTSEKKVGEQMEYESEIEIDDFKYKGSGITEELSREQGSENALKVIVLKKLEQIDQTISNCEFNKECEESDVPIVNVKNVAPENKDESSETTQEMESNEKLENTEEMEENAEEMENIEDLENAEDIENKSDDGFFKELEADNTSWSFLASFAIHKLFTEWKEEGLDKIDAVDVPEDKKEVNTKISQENLQKKHPVQLLHEVRPNCQFIETRDGAPPNVVFSYLVTTDNQTFTGTGRNKKLAKKECAKNALSALGVKYISL